VCAGAAVLAASIGLTASAEAADKKFKIFLSMSYIGNDWQAEAANMVKAMAAHKDFADKVDLQVQVPAGSITVLAAATQTATVTIDGNRGSDEGFATSTRVEFDPPTLSIAAPTRAMLGRDASLDVTVELPAGSSCRVRTASADVRCSGELAAADVEVPVVPVVPVVEVPVVEVPVDGSVESAGGPYWPVDVEPTSLGFSLKRLAPIWVRAVRLTSANFTSSRISPAAGGTGTSIMFTTFVTAAETMARMRSATIFDEIWPEITTTSLIASTFTSSRGKTS